MSLSVLENDKLNLNGKKTKDVKSEIKAKEKFVLSISENGYGKKTSHFDYRVTNRGGKGIIGIINSPRNGNISSSLVVDDSDEIILSTDKGRIMRCAEKEIRIARKKMETAAKNLDFLIAAKYRDEIKKLKKLLQSKKTS